jgi:hypothetical protein
VSVDGTPIDLAKLRSISVGRRTRDQVREFRNAKGERCKATTDELGNTVTVQGDNRQDVNIKAPTITITTRTEEVR